MIFHKNNFTRRKSSDQVKTGVPLREEFPFLADADCPFELQALVTRKISAFHNMQLSYKKLIDCTSLTECANTAGEVLSNYLENRKILDELEYYKSYHKVLGHHPIFQEYQKIKKLRKMNVKDLVRRQIQVENNIWRVKNEMKKKNKPELDEMRKDRLKAYETELDEINNLLDE